jgi:cysteine sulfinate desulfinase/cysteine desulfurase-like protein
MGRDEQTARATIRFSLGRGTTEEEINYTVDALKEVVERAGKTRKH